MATLYILMDERESIVIIGRVPSRARYWRENKPYEETNERAMMHYHSSI